MAITIGRIADKFGSNGSYKQPNSFPVYEKQLTLDRVKPSLNSFISGDIYLTGGDGNHCIYNGAYFALHIIRIIDAKRDRYHYRLERELWFDVLQLGATVKGDLSTSSNEELLEQNLHKTVGILDNPTRVTTINFKTSESRTSFDSVEIKLPKLEIRDEVVSKQAFNDFLSKFNTPYDGHELNDKYFNGARNPAIYLIAKLDTHTISIEGGKQKIIKRIKEFLTTLKENKDQLKVTKVTTPLESKLVGNYCITHRGDGAIGTSDEPYEVIEIDLSGLTGIKSLNISTLKESTPNTFLDLVTEESGGLFDEPAGLERESKLFYGKIARIPHTPVGHPTDYSLLDFPNPSVPFDHQEINGKGTRAPQKINWSYRGKKGTAHLWGVDFLNGIFGNQYVQGAGTLSADIFVDHSDTVVRTSRIGVDKEVFEKNIDNKGTHIPFSIPRLSLDGDGYGDPFKKTLNERVGIGFLIFQIYKNIDQWDLFEYKGKSKLHSVSYISGISTKFFNHYENGTNQHGYNLSDSTGRSNKLAKLQPKGSEVFVRCLIDNDGLFWLAFLPQRELKITNGKDGVFPASESSPNDGAASNYSQDDYGIYGYRGYKYFTYEQIQGDIVDVNKKGIEISPLVSDKHYRAFKTKKSNELREKLIGSNISFADFEEGDKDIVIEEGDYFFSDVDYTIKTYEKPIIFPDLKTRFGNPTAQTHESYSDRQKQFNEMFKRAIISTLRTEDYIMPLPEVEAKKGAYLCTRKDGKIDLRFLYKGSATLSLSKIDNQTVESVDGLKDRKTTFYLLKSGYIIEPGMELTDLDKKNILRDIYKSLGHPVSERISLDDNITPSGLWYSTKQLNEEQVLVDLEGTEWYCLLNKGQVNLIAKSEKPFKPKNNKSEFLNHAENKKYHSVKDNTKPLSLIERINQKVQFRFLTSSYDLNGKTNFSDSDQLSLVYEPAKENNRQTASDYYYLGLDSKHDIIWGEVVTVSKLHTDKATQLAAGTEIEKLRVDILKSKRLFEANQGRYQLSAKRIDENIRRSRMMLDIQKRQADINFATGLFKSLIGGGLSIGETASNLRENARGFHDEVITETHRAFGSADTNPGLFDNDITEDIVTSTLKRTVRNGYDPVAIMKAGLGYLSSYGIDQLGMVANRHLALTQTFAERERAINMTQKLGAEQLALQSLTMNTEFMDTQLALQLEMNRIFSRYDIPLIADSNLDDEYRKNTEIHGKELGKAHLVVYTPSAEQMKYLEEYVEEYGVKCDIPDVETHIYPGMPEGIFCYRNLEDHGILGIENIIIRNYLKTRATVGVKIVKIASVNPSFALLDSERYKRYLAIVQMMNTDEKARLESDYQARLTEVEKQAALEAEKRIAGELVKQRDEIKALSTELETKKGEIEQCRKKESELTKELADEKQAHKEDKEEAEQKLNDERRKFLDEQDKANRLEKEKADANKALEALKAAKATVEGELAKCKQDLAAKPKAGEEVAPKLGIDCNFMIELMKDPYEYDLKARENGGDSFLDLVFEIATNLMIENRTDADQNVSDVQHMRPILQKLEELKNVPIIDKAIELTQDNGGSKYIEWLEKGGSKNGDVDRVITGFNQIKGMVTPPTIHGVKALLDEINYLIYKAKKEIGFQLDQNLFVQFFFKHIYPAKAGDRYRELFGSEEIALMRKKYAEETKCVEAGKGIDVGQGLLNTKKDVETKYKDMKILITTVPRDPARPRPEMPDKEWIEENAKLTPAKPKPATPSPSEPPTELPENPAGYRFARSIDDAAYCGVKLSDIFKKMGETDFIYSQPLFGVEDANTDRSLDTKGTLYYATNYTLDKKPNITKAMQIGNGAYSRTVPRLGNKNQRLIGFKWRDNTCYSDSSDGDQWKNYLVAPQYISVIEVEGRYVSSLEGNEMNRIVIPQEIIEGLKNGSRKLRLRLSDFIGVYQPGVRNDTEIVFFGNSGNELLWPENEIDKFLKVVFYLHFTYIRIKYFDKDSSNGYHVYGWEFGQLHPKKYKNFSNRDLFGGDLNKRIAEIKDETIDLQLGTLFNHMVERMDSSGDIPMPSNVPRSNRTVAFMTLYAFVGSSVKTSRSDSGVVEGRGGGGNSVSTNQKGHPYAWPTVRSSNAINSWRLLADAIKTITK